MNGGVFIFAAVWTRLELATPCVTGRYSNQLNYQTKFTKELVFNSEANIDDFSRPTNSSQKKITFF
jgi:hypothetical protein